MNQLKYTKMNDAVRYPHELDQRDVTTFVEAGQLVERFENILRRYGLSIKPRSDLETACLIIMDLEKRRRGESPIDPMEDIRPPWRKAVGLIEMFKLLIKAEEKANLKRFLPHLHLMNESPAEQNTRVISDQGANKLFEMFIGMLALQVGSEVVLDDPGNSKGNNPDVIAMIDNNKWGFACKVVNGNSIITMFDRFEEGIAQINAADVDCGCVIFNMRNVVDHNQTWPLVNEDAFRSHHEEPLFASWPNVLPVIQYLGGIANIKHQKFVQVNSDQAIRDVLIGKTIPGYLLFLQTTTSIKTSVGNTISTVGILSITPFAPIPKKQFSVLQALNEALHHRG